MDVLLGRNLLHGNAEFELLVYRVDIFFQEVGVGHGKTGELADQSGGDAAGFQNFLEFLFADSLCFLDSLQGPAGLIKLDNSVVSPLLVE